MRRTIFCGFAGIFSVGAALITPPGLRDSAAQAQVIDMTGVACSQFDRLGERRKRSIGVWLHGYYAGTGQRPLLDMGGIEEAVDALISFCAENPDAPLVSGETAGILRQEPSGHALRPGSARPSSGLRIVVPQDTPRDTPRTGPEGRTTTSPDSLAPELRRPRPID
ncbi:MAG: HdeA/HdeB family chaperone [Salinarimonas sp.]